MKLLSIAGVFCAIAVVFYCAYTRSPDAVGIVMLLVFFAYFLNLKSGQRRGNSLLSLTSNEAVGSPIREVAKALACLVPGALGVVVGLRVPDVQLGVAIALTAVVVGVVAFMIFLLQALNAWQSR
jgi:hypothetical protein